MSVKFDLGREGVGAFLTSCLKIFLTLTSSLKTACWIILLLFRPEAISSRSMADLQRQKPQRERSSVTAAGLNWTRFLILDQDSGVSHSLDVLSQLFDQFDVDIGLQQSGAHLLQHGVQHLKHRHTTRHIFQTDVQRPGPWLRDSAVLPLLTMVGFEDWFWCLSAYLSLKWTKY